MLLRLGRMGDEKYLNHSISRPDTNKRAPEPAIFKTLTGTRYMGENTVQHSYSVFR